jgi:hypothetical protein
MTTLAPCWKEGELLRILKPDAEEIDDHVFRAVHCPTELHVGDSPTSALMTKSPEQLVTDFLNPLSNYMQLVVIGESGTGKSHLIQWLRLHIPKDDSTVLLTIPRTGTSLRGIIERIIGQLPAAERAPYEERLKTAGSHAMTQSAKVSRFLNELAHAIEHSKICTNPLDSDLATLLPHIFLDPNLRAGFFMQPGGTTDLIVQHIFSDPDSREQDERKREFRQGDLPLDVQSYQQAAQLTRDAFEFIKLEPGMEQRAINLMNAHRNIAIAQTLNFSADHLIELMNTLRRHLARQGKRLILLIEDFARVQGIDTALLQALITPPKQGDDHLCELRWAMAVTSGPYKLIDATVRTRTTIVVDMDRSQPTSLQRLTAGYLNALRLGMHRLEQVPVTDAPSSHCGSCQHRQSCLSAFGEVDGIGLFPFTQTAINTMARRTGSLHADGSFNARRYMRSVLETVMKHHYADLSQGEFPSTAMLRRIGGTAVLTPAQRQDVKQRDEAFAERRIALLELWQGSGEIANLDPGIHAAFGIPALHGAAARATSGETGVPEPEAGGGAVARLPNQVGTLRKWANGEMVLPSAVVNDLRVLVYGAIEGHIDWDMLGMARTAVAGATTPKAAFRQTSINFEAQQTQRLISMVILDLKRDEALALEALLSYKHYQNWNFPDGVRLLINLMESLEHWSAQVRQQLRSLFGPQKTWHPVAACAELLALAHYAAGRVKLDTDNETLAIQIWGKPQLAPATFASSALRQIAIKLTDKVPLLLGFLQAHSSGTKGGQIGRFVRMTPAFTAVRALRLRGLQLIFVPPEQSDSPEVQAMIDLYRSVKDSLPAALEDERRVRSDWYRSANERLGEQSKISALIGSLRELIDDVVNRGIRSGTTRNQLEEILSDLRPQTLDNALGHGLAIAAASNGETLIRAGMIGEHADTITQLVMRADSFVEAVTQFIDNQGYQYGQQAVKGLADSEARIAAALTDIVKALGAVAQLSGSDYELA